MAKIITFNRRTLFAPYLIFIMVIGAAFWQHEWWLLIAIPLIYLGWICSAPNLNLANGCLPNLLWAIGLIAFCVFREIPLLVIPGICWATWLASSLEVVLRYVLLR
jgi:hypothetical protein